MRRGLRPQCERPVTPASQNVSVVGPYNVVLNSTNGHGTLNIYTDFTQTGLTFTSAANTLLCPANDLSKCVGADMSGASITASGTIGGSNVTMTISFLSTAGADTLTLGDAATGTNVAGSYTDSLGDAGMWTAFVAPNISGTFNGTFNSASNPLPIGPTIMMTLLHESSANVGGTATVMNWPCISSLTLSGRAIGGAFSLADAANKILIIAVPQPASNNLAFSYKIDSTAPSCAGDFGQGRMTNSGPFDY